MDSAVEADRRRVASAQDDADLLARPRPVPAAQESGEGRRSARLYHHPEQAPECLLGLQDGLIGDEQCAGAMAVIGILEEV